ncbi:MAG TPA: pentapeptide repeat-containing protein, partial [Ktedonobacteraceae bacterium]
MKSPNNTTEPCWGEFPSKQRQAELRQRIQVWAQEDDHGDQPGPFAEFKLTGADIFWLVAWVAGGEDAEAGKASLDKYQHGVGLSVRVDLSDLPLDGASLYRAHLENAQLFRVQLRSASLYGAYLEGADLGEAQLQHANLFEAQLQQAKLSRAQMQGANLNKAQMEGADLNTAQLEGANLTEAHLQRANLQWTQLQNARLHNTYFQRAALRWTQLQGADLTYCDLRGADLRSARLDINTILDRTRLDDQVHLADVAWNGSSLSRVDWEAVPRLGDEVNPGSDESPRDAARAYRQLAVALREQGITEAADRY